MKTAELTGRLLDQWVARTEGHDPARYIVPEYSVDWFEAGPIIERERIMLSPEYEGGWHAAAYGDAPDQPATAYDSSPLVAAMRAYVASEFGDTVPDEQAA